ncbi:MAG: hypothetical protein LUI10_09390 [Lachnospiraceae bacterium]|nr:hypothetical protein [Lachnospiraceae bacterium]
MNSKKISLTFIWGILASMILVLLLYGFCGGLNGNDFWWHVKVGQWIVEHGSVPTTDIFSWIGQAYGISWTAHEWLSEVIFYVIFASWGEAGIYVLCVSLAILLMLFLMYTSRKMALRNILLAGIFFALFAVVMRTLFYGRPHIFGFLLLAATLKILYTFYENTESRLLFLMPLLSCLWSNLHGGSAALSYILCSAMLVVSLLNFRLGRVVCERKSRAACGKLAAVTALTIAGILVNPIGARVLLYPYVNLSDKLMMTVISEWQAPDAKDMGQLIVYFLPIVLMTIGLVTEREDVRFLDIVIMGIFLLLFFRSVRFIMCWYIAAPFYAFRYLPVLPMKEVDRRSDRLILRAVALILAFLLCAAAYRLARYIRSGDDLISVVVSDEMIAVIKEDDPKQIFNDYNTGETLIYHDIEVFVDSRADVYAAEHILEDVLSLSSLYQYNEEAATEYTDVDALMESYQFDAMLVLKSRPLYAYLISHPDRFLLMYEDENMGYFKVLS